MYISSDTNVWIDFFEIECLSYPFLLKYKYYISSYALKDEFCKTESMKIDLMKYGLNLTDVTDEEFADVQAYRTKYHRLSLYDAFALAIAKRRGWVLLSGDGPLRRAAGAEGVECHGTIWICDQLKDHGIMTGKRYTDLIEKLIEEVKKGNCRLPMAELLKRKR